MIVITIILLYGEEIRRGEKAHQTTVLSVNRKIKRLVNEIFYLLNNFVD